MNVFLLVLCGAAGGILGGMGMGGGTALIPALDAFFGIGQKEAQAISLVAFCPMAAVALFIHAKNGRIEKKGIVFLIVPALVTAVIGGFIASSTDGKTLRKLFGAFLIAIAVFSLKGRGKRKIADKPVYLLENKDNMHKFD